MSEYKERWSAVLVDLDDKGIAWVTFNRPEKRNAMNPTMNREMIEVLETLEMDQNVKLLVMAGAGESWTAGMDLKEYFRETENEPDQVKERLRQDCSRWQWKMLRFYGKPTIAMVNGWCFGGAFSPLVACDLAVCADEAVFGLSTWSVRRSLIPWDIAMPCIM